MRLCGAAEHGIARPGRRLAALKLAALTLIPTGFAESAQTPTRWSLWQAGRLRGFTSEDLPRLDCQTLDAVRATGATLARIGLYMDACSDACTDGSALRQEDARRLPALLDHARDIGLDLVVLGSFEPGQQHPQIWRSPEIQAQFVATWTDFAQRIGDHPALAGIDLLNEPHPPFDLSHQLVAAQTAWLELAGRAIDALRRRGCNAPIVFQSVAGGNALGLRGMRPLADPAVVYSIHFYTPHDITHQGVGPSWSRRIPYPATVEWGLGAWDRELGIGAIDAARLEAEVRVARAFQLAHDVPIYVGEFGCVRWAPDGSALRWVNDCVELFARYGWSWTFHSFRTWPGWDPEIDSEDPQVRIRSTDAPLIRRLRAAIAVGDTR